MKEVKTLAELRKSKNKSQADTGKYLGMTAQGYSLIERGERSLKAVIAVKLAEFFGVSVNEIIFLSLNNNSKLLSTGTEGDQ